MHGVIVSINVSKKKGERKRSVRAAIVTEKGIKGDAHEGGERQISILAEESIIKLRNKGINVGYGDFAENLTIKGIEIKKIKVGQKIIIGKNVVLEVTHIGKRCHEGCAIRKIIGDCIMPREGIFARVLKGGTIKVGDVIEIKNSERL